MDGDSDFAALEAATAAIFSLPADDPALAAALASFHAACLAQLPALGERGSMPAAGLALSPGDAARCVLDAPRTASLVRALDARIAARVAREGEARVLYAGCGPLAPLVLLLARRWRDRAVQFELVDLHAQSIAAATRLFADAGCSGMLRRAQVADATTLQLDAGDAQPHILVAEVMQAALAREPQVAVVANLLPQCLPQSDLVPERIVVEATLAAEPGSAAPPIGIGTLLELSSASVPALAAAVRRGDALPERVVSVPPYDGDPRMLALATRIVCEGVDWVTGQSGLTLPVYLFAQGAARPGDCFGFTYQLRGNPGFIVRRLEAQSPRD